MKKLSLAIVLVLTIALGIAVTSASAGECGCCCGGPGVGTPGYWKNHPDAWPVDVIDYGGLYFTKAEALEWLNAPVKGDKSITMFKAWLAAYLNAEAENCYGCIQSVWWEATDWLIHNPVGTDVRGRSEAWQYSHGEALYWALDAYNNGLMCAPPRD